jgi:hypothetical protein
MVASGAPGARPADNLALLTRWAATNVEAELEPSRMIVSLADGSSYASFRGAAGEWGRSYRDHDGPRMAYSTIARKAPISAAISSGYSPLIAWEASG